MAKAVRFSQSIERSATPLKVGDSLTRRLWVEAEGAQGMLIPPAEFATIDGLKSYPLPAEVKPLSDGRGAISQWPAARCAQLHHPEQPGSYRLPALQLQWWDATSATLRTSQVPAVEFEAIANTAYRLPFDFSADLQNLSRGQPLKLSTSKLLLGAGALGLLIGLYLARARLRQQYQHWLAWRRARHSAWLASEGYAWNQLQRALKTSAVPLQPLYRWLQRSLGSPQLSALSEHLPAPQAQALRQALAARYAAADKAAPLIDLRSSLRAMRPALRRARKRHAADELLRPLNPQHTGRRAE
ncbi:MAG: BatD family protein [Rhodoferax sp.]|nr:BatD family protein [Rhodoferax sp.]